MSKKVTISNTEGTSQLLIPSAERSDTGIYTIIVKNIVGQEAYSIEIRVTGAFVKHCINDSLLIHILSIKKKQKKTFVFELQMSQSHQVLWRSTKMCLAQ